MRTYTPLDTLKRVMDDIWIVDGPLIRFGVGWLGMKFPTRMTIIRLEDDALFIHSPIRLAAHLKEELRHIGRVRWIIAPNRLHYWWVPEWHAAFPDAEIYLAPRIDEQAPGHIAIAGLPLNRDSGFPWDAAIATLPVAGRYMTEIVFFHRASLTLVLTDLIENFEREKLGIVTWLLARFGHVLDPDGQMPRDMRLTFPKRALRAAVERMIGWNPQRIVLAHGRWYEANGTAELRRAFRWLLP